MKFAAFTTLIYGFLVLIGGVMGHLKAQSKASLYSGLIFGVLLLLSGWGLFKGMKISAYASLLLTLSLLAFFLWRYIQTHKIFPPAIMALLSLLVLIILLLSLLRKNTF